MGPIENVETFSWIFTGVFKEESNTFLLFIIIQGNNNDSNHSVDHRPGRQQCDGPSLFSTMRHLFIFCAHCGTKTNHCRLARMGKMQSLIALLSSIAVVQRLNNCLVLGWRWKPRGIVHHSLFFIEERKRERKKIKTIEISIPWANFSRESHF